MPPRRKPKNAPVREPQDELAKPPDDSGQTLWSNIRKLAKAGDEDALSELTALEGLGGRPVAKLFIMVYEIEQRYSADAEKVEEAKAAVVAADRKRTALGLFRPASADEAIDRAERWKAANREWSAA